MAALIRFAFLSFLSQAIALLSGILVVRSLSTEDYALYSICGSVVAALIALSDSGVNSKLLSRLGEIRSAGGNSMPVLRAARHVRSLTLVSIVPLICGFEFYLLFANGAELSVAILLTALTAVAAVPEILSALARVGLQVYFMTDKIQWALIGSTGSRFIAFSLIAFFVVPASPSLFLLATVITGIAQALYLSISLPRARDTSQLAPANDVLENRRFRGAFFATLPQSLSVIAGEQWITAKLTMAGNVSGIAELAALSRFALVFAVANMVVSNVVAPRFAVASVDRSSSRRALRSIAGSYAILALFFIAAIGILAPYLIAILGPAYSGLEAELVVVCAGYAVSNFAAFGIGGVNHARGWISGSWLYFPLLLVWAISCEALVDPATTFGPAIYSASLAVVMLLTQSYRFVVGYRKLGN